MDTDSLSEFFLCKDLTWSVILFRLVYSFFAGFLIGFERKKRFQSAGLRTHMLICITSTLIMLVSLYVSQLYDNKGDPARMAAQIVSGIGFLGAGAILKQGFNIKGLTSAATIWASAGLGIAIGTGFYEGSLIALVACYVSLSLIEKFENYYFPSNRFKKLYLVFHNDKIDLQLLKKIVSEKNIMIVSTDVSKAASKKRICVTILVNVQSDVDFFGLAESIEKIGTLEKIKLED